MFSNGNESTAGELSLAEASALQKILRTKLVEIKNDIEIERANPNSPLYSVTSFESLKLPKQLLKGVFAMGYTAPSKIQETALPMLLADPPTNFIAQAQSGTGKTAAFVLAMLARVDPTKNCTQVLCLSPTYELALQTADVTKQMAKFCPDIKIRSVVRGDPIPYEPEIEDHIIIGTPGKVLDWSLKFAKINLSSMKVFVLDEADIMLAMQGHGDQSIRIHKRLPERCQSMLFSATYEQELMEFAETIILDPVIIRLRPEELTLENVKQFYMLCRSRDERYNALCNIYGGITVGQAIIFSRTKAMANFLVDKMGADGHAVSLLTGDQEPEERKRVLNNFRESRSKVLITTNVLARGIDIEQVTLVINLDVPSNALDGSTDMETYLHRIGRTGRFGKQGIAITMIEDSERRRLREIEEYFSCKIPKIDPNSIDDIGTLEQW